MLIMFFAPCAAQEVFLNKNTSEVVVSTGETDQDASFLGVYLSGTAKKEDTSLLEKTDYYNSGQFLDFMRKENLEFSLEGYEPFWSARLSENKFIFFNTQSGKEENYKIRLLPAKGLSSHNYYMFSNTKGSVYGVINYLGYSGKDQRFCEYNISEEGKSLYEVFIAVNGSIYEGCAVINAKSD